MLEVRFISPHASIYRRMCTLLNTFLWLLSAADVMDLPLCLFTQLRVYFLFSYHLSAHLMNPAPPLPSLLPFILLLSSFPALFTYLAEFSVCVYMFSDDGVEVKGQLVRSWFSPSISELWGSRSGRRSLGFATSTFTTELYYLPTFPLFIPLSSLSLFYASLSLLCFHFYPLITSSPLFFLFRPSPTFLFPSLLLAPFLMPFLLSFLPLFLLPSSQAF